MYGIHKLGFIDRMEELAYLKGIEKKDFFVLIKGRRRIGKTRITYEAFNDYIYVFIWPDKSVGWILERIAEEQGIPLFSRFSDMLNYLLDTGKVVIFDEFQNIHNIDKSLAGEVQEIIDTRKRKGKITRFVVLGSSYTLLKKVFRDYSSPLYGRLNYVMTLDHLPLVELYKTLNVSIEDFTKIWSVFEGVPYYYEFIDFKRTPEENIIALLLNKNAPLQEEGKVLVSLEFGSDSKIYTTILSAIANGKTKLGEISALFGEKSTSAVKYLDTLRKEFNLVRRETPIFEDPKKSKNGIYEVRDNFLSFWYYFIDRRRDYIEQERFSELISQFERDFPAFAGRKFEKFVTQLLREGIIPLEPGFEKIGRQWGRIDPNYKEKKNSQTYEIDIAMENAKSKSLALVECKWKNNVNGTDIAKRLIKKRDYLRGNYKAETYLVFARSFSKKVDMLEGKSIRCFDLRDLDQFMRKNK